MAENPYVNRVETADGTTIMDISDTTATAGDVVSGTVFYTASGARSVGSLNVSGYVVGPSSATDSHVAAFDGTSGKLIKDSGYTIGTSVPSNAVFTDHEYTAGTGLTLSGSEFSANVYNGLDKSDSGYVLDARQGKTLSDNLYVIGSESTFTDGYTNAASGQHSFYKVIYSASDVPVSGNTTWVCEQMKMSSTYGWQKATTSGITSEYIRVLTNGTWSSWYSNKDTIDSHYGAMGTSTTPVTSRANIPLNWIGNVTMSSSISPSGYTRSHSVIKWGLSTTRYHILAIDQYENKMYLYENYDGTYIDWRSIEPDSVFMMSETKIPSNSDLDNYNTPGVYTVANSTTAAAISNIPYTSSGGRLEVIGQNSNSSYQRQMYYPSGSVYIYTRIKGSSAWGSWYRVNMTQA